MAEMNALGDQESKSKAKADAIAAFGNAALINPNDKVALDAAIIELGSHMGLSTEVDFIRSLVEAVKSTTITSEQAVLMSEAVKSGEVTKDDALKAIAEKPAAAVAGTTSEQTAASAANTQAQAGAAASADAAIAAAASHSGNAMAAVDGASAAAAASTEATVTPASKEKDAKAILEKLNIGQKQGGGLAV